MSSIVLLTEDAPSEAVAEKILASITNDVRFEPRLGGRGVGYVASKLKGLNESATGLKILALADRDSPAHCPIDLINAWVGGPRNPHLVVRLAEMEIESWLLADQEAMAQELLILPNRIPPYPDMLLDPKLTLVNLARTSRSSEVRLEMCPAAGSTAQVGPVFNLRMIRFIQDTWSVERAIRSSPSLRRAETRLRELVAL